MQEYSDLNFSQLHNMANSGWNIVYSNQTNGKINTSEQVLRIIGLRVHNMVLQSVSEEQEGLHRPHNVTLNVRLLKYVQFLSEVLHLMFTLFIKTYVNRLQRTYPSPHSYCTGLTPAAQKRMKHHINVWKLSSWTWRCFCTIIIYYTIFFDAHNKYWSDLVFFFLVVDQQHSFMLLRWFQFSILQHLCASNAVAPHDLT